MKQYQTDRVCVITCESFDAFDGNIQYQLIIEMMGKHANLILIKDGLILEAYKKMVHETSRSIAYHLPFSFFFFLQIRNDLPISLLINSMSMLMYLLMKACQRFSIRSTQNRNKSI